MSRARLRLAIGTGLLALVVTLGACGPDTAATATPDAPVAVTGPQQGPSPTAIASPSPTPAATATPTPSPTPLSNGDAYALSHASGDAYPYAGRFPWGNLNHRHDRSSPGTAKGDALVARLGGRAWDFLVALTEQFSPRASATDQERVAAQFLAGEFEALGYQAEIRPFTIEVLSTETSALALNAPEEREIEGFPMRLSGRGQARGFLVDAGKGLEGDLPDAGLEGNIAIIERGVVTFEEKVKRVAEAGAIAAVVYNNQPGPFGGRLMTQADIPVISISRESGESVLSLMANGDVEATVSVVVETRDSRNVVAELPGAAGEDGVVVLGAHYDTVPNTNGANDNGSGVATLLTLAREVRDVSYPFTLRFVTFGSEEVGLFGSRSYVDSLSADDRDAVIAMLNFDVTGSGDGIEVLGNIDLVIQVLDYGTSGGVAVKMGFPLGGASSDHTPFMEAGIPAMFFLADDLSRINAPGDDLEFVKPELMGTAAALGLGLLDSLAGR